MPQLEHIEAIERRLWEAADTLRANSNYASNEYFLPVMGLVFLRHAYSRYLSVKDDIEAAGLPTRAGKRRALTKADFSQRSAIFLRPEAQFDSLVDLPDSADRAKAIIAAMESIEGDYESLRGALPTSEYRELDNAVLGQLLRQLNPDELKRVSGDVFGRIYEYFLTQFADEKAHDNGEFFTPVSLVSLIAHVLDPACGTVLDPACGSGGMFVQSARTVAEHGQHPTEQLTFRGLEKNATTIRLARMNLAVHGLEGDIKQAITYYEDPHELVGKADYVMANPPFNVDEIDADKVETDPRLHFGLPGVNKKGKVSNGNYIWISYFYRYLNETGRAGFVMSSQASSAGGGEARVRRQVVETGDVEVMIAIRSNFFYTRSVPCELWFFNRAKAEARRDKVLMIDARNIYRKVTRKIYDFSAEQAQNLLGIVWLSRGETARFLDLVSRYLSDAGNEARACFERGRATGPLPEFVAALADLQAALVPVLKILGADAGMHAKLDGARRAFIADVDAFEKSVSAPGEVGSSETLGQTVDCLAPMAESSRSLVEQAELLYKLVARLIETGEKGDGILATKGTKGVQLAPASSKAQKASDAWNNLVRARRAIDDVRQRVVAQLEQVGYFWRQARWLTERFPDAKLRDVEGLVKLVDRAEIEANDWSLTPGRYVGVAPEEADEDFDFAEALRDIHVELKALNAEAVTLATTIQKNFEELL